MCFTFVNLSGRHCDNIRGVAFQMVIDEVGAKLRKKARLLLQSPILLGLIYVVLLFSVFFGGALMCTGPVLRGFLSKDQAGN